MSSPLRVVIIGGGPAGTACALRLKRLSKEQNRKIEVAIIEGKRFTDGHYNPCVGVLSPPLQDLLAEEIGVPFPHHLTRTIIKGYVLHSAKEKLVLSDKYESSALRRVEFDAFMLEAAKALGVEVRQARAVDLEFHDSKAIVYTENAPVECDVLVGAFGLDEASAAMFSRATPYRSPDALLSIVTKYHPPPKFMEEFGALIQAFIPADRGIEFAGITPKGDHLAINIAGRKVDAPTMDKFLSKPKVAALLGNPTVPNPENPSDWRYFKGRFPCELAKKYYGHRYVMTGDAAGLVRPFKGKGVTSAIHSGIRAANTIVNVGVTSKAFHDDYRTANQDILKDLLWGRTARLATLAMSEVGLLNVIVRAGKKNPKTYAALLGAVSAHASYRTVFRHAFSPGSLKAVALALLRPNSK